MRLRRGHLGGRRTAGARDHTTSDDTRQSGTKADRTVFTRRAKACDRRAMARTRGPAQDGVKPIGRAANRDGRVVVPHCGSGGGNRWKIAGFLIPQRWGRDSNRSVDPVADDVFESEFVPSYRNRANASARVYLGLLPAAIAEVSPTPAGPLSDVWCTERAADSAARSKRCFRSGPAERGRAWVLSP